MVNVSLRNRKSGNHTRSNMRSKQRIARSNTRNRKRHGGKPGEKPGEKPIETTSNQKPLSGDFSLISKNVVQIFPIKYQVNRADFIRTLDPYTETLKKTTPTHIFSKKDIETSYEHAEETTVVSSATDCFSDENSVFLKLWGWAGMKSASNNMANVYEIASQQFIEEISLKHNTVHNVIVHYDGDPMCEKKADKFTHALFFPIVLSALKEAGYSVHLVITKFDTDGVSKLLAKFFTVNKDTYTLNTKPDPRAPEMQRHYHPYIPFADKITFILAQEKPGKIKEYESSEIWNENLLRFHFPQAAATIDNRYCICVGANAEQGIQGIRNFLQKNIFCKTFHCTNVIGVKS